MNIVYVQSDKQIDQIRKLFKEYEAFLGINLNFQNFEAELKDLPGKYAPPDGALFLVMNHGDVIGCGALRRFGSIEENMCEMKRLFICPEARGLGAGRKLALMIVQEAIRIGYSTMLLDTLDRLNEAMTLYESIGFVRTEPYYENPLPDVVYWALNLKGQDIASVTAIRR